MKDKKKVFTNTEKLAIAIAFLIMIIISFSTKFIGSTDIDGHIAAAKYFAGYDFSKIRSSQSYLWGFVNAPLVKLFGSLIGFKILSFLMIFLIIYSVYYMSGKDKRAFFLMLASPIVWYMAPWVNSIQVASLFFLWSYFFMQRYDENNYSSVRYLFYSGVLFGLAAAFWHAVFFFGIFFILIFFYNKQLSHFIYYLCSIFVGLIPLFVFDYFWFGFPFRTLLKSNFGTLSNFFGIGMNPNIGAKLGLISALVLFLMIPFYFWRFYKIKDFRKNYKLMIFLSISLLIILKNPQPRYLFLIIPIILLNVVKNISKRQFGKLLLFSAIISIIVLVPYEIQIKYQLESKDSPVRDANGYEIKVFLEKLFDRDLTISSINKKEVIEEDINRIAEDYPQEVFIVGGFSEDYYLLHEVYWGDKVKEFVSIQDYNLFLKNESNLIEREFRSGPKRINDRREIWIKGGIGKPLNDPTDYESIKYAISLDKNLDLEGFKKLKEYEVLSVYGRM